MAANSETREMSEKTGASTGVLAGVLGWLARVLSIAWNVMCGLFVAGFLISAMTAESGAEETGDGFWTNLLILVVIWAIGSWVFRVLKRATGTETESRNDTETMRTDRTAEADRPDRPERSERPEGLAEEPGTVWTSATTQKAGSGHGEGAHGDSEYVFEKKLWLAVKEYKDLAEGCGSFVESVDEFIERHPTAPGRYRKLAKEMRDSAKEFENAAPRFRSEFFDL